MEPIGFDHHIRSQEWRWRGSRQPAGECHVRSVAPLVYPNTRTSAGLPERADQLIKRSAALGMRLGFKPQHALIQLVAHRGQFDRKSRVHNAVEQAFQTMLLRCIDVSQESQCDVQILHSHSTGHIAPTLRAPPVDFDSGIWVGQQG